MKNGRLVFLEDDGEDDRNPGRVDRNWGGKADEDEDAGGSGVKSVGNTIYYYADVNRPSILALNTRLRKLAYESRKRALQEEQEPVGITLRISSYGGSVFAGIAGMDAIRTCPVPVTTVVEGGAASAATFLSVAGSKRVITRHSFMLIHQLSSFMWGKYSEFKDEMSNLDKIMRIIKDVYSRRTKIPEAKLEEILQHDLWFDANECIEQGLVDRIEG